MRAERLRTAAAVTGWAAAGPLAALGVLRLVWHDGAWPLLVANMFTVWLLIPVWGALGLGLAARRWPLVAVAGAVAAWHLALVVPWVGERAPPPMTGDGVRVVSANLLMVHPDPDALAAELEAFDADVMVLQEYSGRWWRIARERGWVEQWPEYLEIVREDSFGCAIFSRVPLLDADVVELVGLPQLQATIAVDGVAVDLLDVYTLPPRIASYVPGHREALAGILAWAGERQAQRAFVVTGDFNATEHSRFHRRMTRLADDAWELGGRGMGFTAPNGLFPLPPMRMDHVYVSPGLTVADVGLGQGVGSDHRPIVVTVGVR